jgi:hypothetical protein
MIRAFMSRLECELRVTLPDTRQQSVLVVEGDARRGNLVKNVQINARQVAAVLPGRAHFAFKCRRGILLAETVVMQVT